MRISKRRQQYLDKFKFPYHGQIFSSIKACCEYYDVAYSCVFPAEKGEKYHSGKMPLTIIKGCKKRTIGRRISTVKTYPIYEGML